MPLYSTTYIAGEEVNLRLTDDYHESENRSLSFTSENFPNLENKIINIYIDNLKSFVKQLILVNSKKIRVDLSHSELNYIGAGRWNYEVTTTGASGHIETIFVGNLVITPEFGD